MSWQGQLLRYYFISSPSQSLIAAPDNMLQSFSLLNQRDLFLPFLTQSRPGARCTTYPGREEHCQVRHKKSEAVTPSLYALGHTLLYNVLK